MIAPTTSIHKIQIISRPSCSFAPGQAVRMNTSPKSRCKLITRSASNESSDPQNSSDSDSPSSSNPPAAAPPRIVTSPPPGRSFPPPPPSAMQPGLKFQKVETLGTDSIAGVAAVEKSSKSGESPTSLSKAIKLAVGDTVALLIFATIGRVSHHEALSLSASFETALPFLLGWFVTAPFLGGFGKEAQGGDVGSAVGSAAKSWIVAVPVGIVIRSLMRGYVPDKAFIIVSFVATAVLLFGGRAAQAAITPAAAAGDSSSRKNKRGNPFEFFSLLASLTKRW